MASHPHVLPLPESSPLRQLHPTHRRILVVDDHHSLRAAIALALRRIGCFPVEATSAEEGWIAASTSRFDLVLVSHSLPDMSGAELVRLLRGASEPRLRATPVIGLSHEEQCEQALLGIGVECVLRSPFRECDLMRAMRWVADVYWAEEEEEVVAIEPEE